MSVITKDLGVATAYGYAKSKGYTGTEEEFAELMASYADVAEQAEAAAQDAEDAKDAAVSAKNDAVTAKTAAQAAQSAAETASGTATTKASEVAQSAQSAAGSASAAQTSATAASGSASTAQTAAQTATSKASEAASSASAASTAKTGAETARTGAQTAQANAEAAASSVSASAAQIEQNTEDIAGLKNDLNQFPNGNYPQMGAGYANQLVSGLKKEDSTPYNFRAVPYDATLEEVEKIVGGTIAWKQLIQNGNFASGTDNWQANNGTLSAQNGVLTYVRGSDTGSNQIFQFVNATVNHVLFGSAIVRVSTSTSRTISMRIGDLENTRDYSVTPNTWTEITTIKKANINNPEFNIYGRITNEWSEGDTVDIKECMCFDIAQMFGTSIADYVYSLEAATAGAGVAWLKTHFPAQFDAGYQAYDAGTLKSIEGLTAHTTVADGITHTYALDSDVVLRGIPKLDSNNQLYYDGDEYLPDGTVNRRYGIVDLGTMDWNTQDAEIHAFRSSVLSTAKYAGGVSCAKYVATARPQYPLSTWGDKEIGVGNSQASPFVYIVDSAYSDATALKTSLSGVYLVYEKATATTETADSYTTPQIISPDGTEEYIYEDGAFELPVGHSSEYPANVSGQLDDILDTPSANGTYTLKATVTDGAVTYSWVADA